MPKLTDKIGTDEYGNPLFADNGDLTEFNPNETTTDIGADPEDWVDETPNQPEINDWMDEPQANAKPEVGASRTVLDQGLQGATAATADEVTDRIGTAIAAPATETGQVGILKSLIMGGGNPIDTIRAVFGNKELNSLNDLSRDISKERMSQEMEQRPALSIASNIGGALLTGGAGATTKTGTAIGNSLRAGNAATRIAKGAAAGATSGAAYGAGAADDGNRLEGAGQGAITGALLGGAIPAAGSVVKSTVKEIGNTSKGALARSPETVQAATDAMKEKAVALRDKMREIGASISPETNKKLLTNIQANLEKVKLIPGLNPKTMAIVQDIEKIAKERPIEIDELDQYRRLLRGARDEDAVASGAVRKAIDDTLNGLGEADFMGNGKEAVGYLNKFRKDYSQASKFEDISDILTKADGDPNKLKSALTRYVNNSDNTRGWSDHEVKLLKDAARSSTPEKLLKMGGKFGIDLGSSFTAGNTFLPAASGFVSPIIPAAGTVARMAQKGAARGKVEKLLQALEQGKKPSIKEINALPVKEAKMILERMKSASIATQSPNLNDKKK